MAKNLWMASQLGLRAITGILLGCLASNFPENEKPGKGLHILMRLKQTWLVAILVAVFFFAGMPPRAQAARGRDYVMIASGTLSVTLLGVLIYQAITAEEGKATSPAPDAVEQVEEQAKEAVQKLGEPEVEATP
jgi:membrane protein YqaA with SNARE-associated domain